LVDLRYRGPRPAWHPNPAVELVSERDGGCRLLVGPDVDLPALMAAAQLTTDLVSFSYEPPTLSELFRQAVAPCGPRARPWAPPSGSSASTR
jgi:ABC-2 type transport system ATP-binding protein